MGRPSAVSPRRPAQARAGPSPIESRSAEGSGLTRNGFPTRTASILLSAATDSEASPIPVAHASAVDFLVVRRIAGSRASVVVTLLVLVAPGVTTAATAGDSGRLAVPRFVEEAMAAGVAHVYGGGYEFFVGGGVAVLDCDEDGRPDLYLAGGAESAGLFRNESPVGGPFQFSRVAHPVTDLVEVTGAYPLDIDGDGYTDLAVLRRGEDVLLRGLGSCSFERANEAWSFDGGDAWTTAFSAKWEAGASLPTLALGSYLEIGEPGHTDCATSVIHEPVENAGAIDDAPAYGQPIALSPGYCSLSMLFSDWDRSGRRDLRVTNDRHYHRDGEDQLFRVEQCGAPRAWTREEGWRQLRVWGMGIASHDLTGDGFPEVYVTSIGDNKLQTLADGPGQPDYRDIALKAGVTAHQPFTGGESLPSTAWHAEFADVNNDRRIDLFVSKGNVEAMPENAMLDPSNLFLGRRDGTFSEAADRAGIVDFDRGRGAALVELDLDGLLDLVQVRRHENVAIWRNMGVGSAEAPRPVGNWLALQLVQDDPNADAVGSWLTVTAGGDELTRELTVGGGHAGGQLGWIHFGLGDATQARVRVRWPDGSLGPGMRVPANSFIVLERGADEPILWRPGGDR
ncbi:CRTAC1 family protein [soil metagenome]